MIRDPDHLFIVGVILGVVLGLSLAMIGVTVLYIGG